MPKKPARTGATIVARVLDALVEAGVAHRFDAEFSGTPVPHDRLLVDLARLVPDVHVDEVEQVGPEPDVEDYAYTIRFTSGGRLYEVRCGDQSDWFDHEPVAGLLNHALAAAGKDVRLIRVGLEPQFPVYLCALPAAVDRVAQLGLIAVG